MMARVGDDGVELVHKRAITREAPRRNQPNGGAGDVEVGLRCFAQQRSDVVEILRPFTVVAREDLQRQQVPDRRHTGCEVGEYFEAFRA